MEYSKIKTLKAVNFRSLGSVEIDMSESPIVALTGTNEGGKSSLIYAFGAAAGNLRRSKHTQYIRSGTDGFAVLIELEDGTKVLRKKSSSVNSYTLVTATGDRKDATKIDVEVPDYITAVMGMFRDPETKEYLQVRTCDDPLLFVNTTDGQNYKSMHNAINNLDVREATVKAKADASSLLELADKKRTEVEIYKKQLSELPLLDTDYLKVIIAALDRASKLSVKFDAAIKDAELVASLYGVESVEQLNKCDVIDMDAMRVFTDAMRNLDAVKSIESVDYTKVVTVDAQAQNLFEKALNLHGSLKENAVHDIPDTLITVQGNVLPLFDKAIGYLSSVKEASATHVPETVKTLDVSALVLFEKAFGYMSDMVAANTSYETLTAGIKKVTDVLKASGMRVISCDNCGHDIAIPSIDEA